MMLKLVVLSICVMCCVGFPHPSRFFGRILNNALWKYRYLGSESVLKQANRLKENRMTFTFPKPERQDPNTEYIINSIEQIDHSKHKAKVDFVEGGIGSNKVTMTVTVPEGKEIGSQFNFYGMMIPRHPATDALAVPSYQKPLEVPKEQQAILHSHIVPETVENPKKVSMEG